MEACCSYRFLVSHNNNDIFIVYNVFKSCLLKALYRQTVTTEKTTPFKYKNISSKNYPKIKCFEKKAQDAI